MNTLCDRQTYRLQGCRIATVGEASAGSGTPQYAPGYSKAPKAPREITFLILLLIALSFVAQPTMYRPLGIPLSLACVASFVFLWFALELRIKPIRLLAFAPFPAFLVLSDLLFGVGSRGSVLALMIVFSFFGKQLFLSERQLIIIWTALAWVCFFLAMLGTYRYLHGYVAPFSQNEGGVSELETSYFYLGISYLPATRNSDALYFVAGLVASLRLTLSVNRYRLIYVVMAVLLAGVIGLTLSRGAYVAALVSSWLILKPQHRRKAIGILCGFLSIAFLFFSITSSSFSGKIIFVYSLIESAIVSLFDPASANRGVQGFYTYSNNERIDLYLATLKQFSVWPVGQGMDNPHFGSANKGTSLLHSENIFLDFIIIFGVFSLPLFAFYLVSFKAAYKRFNRSINARMAISVGCLCIVFGLFNSPVNLVVYWFLIVLGLAETNAAKDRILGLRPNPYFSGQ